MLSLGGGAITSPGVREALSGHTVIYLEISASEGLTVPTPMTLDFRVGGTEKTMGEKMQETNEK